MVSGSRTVWAPGRGLSREQVMVCLLTVAQKKPMFANRLTALMKVTMLLLILGGGGGGGGWGGAWVQDNTCTVLGPSM